MIYFLNNINYIIIFLLNNTLIYIIYHINVGTCIIYVYIPLASIKSVFLHLWAAEPDTGDHGQKLQEFYSSFLPPYINHENELQKIERLSVISKVSINTYYISYRLQINNITIYYVHVKYTKINTVFLLNSITTTQSL